MTVYLNAMDTNDMPNAAGDSVPVTIYVNPAPVLNPDRTLAAEYTKKRGTDGEVTVVSGLAGFFSDNNEMAVTATVTSNQDGVLC